MTHLWGVSTKAAMCLFTGQCLTMSKDVPSHGRRGWYKRVGTCVVHSLVSGGPSRYFELPLLFSPTVNAG